MNENYIMFTGMKNSTLHKGFNKFPQDERLVEFPSSCEGFLFLGAI